MKKYDYNPYLFSNAYEYVNSICSKYANRIAFCWKEKNIYRKKTYLEVVNDVSVFISQMEKRELIGRHIALIGEASYEWIIAFLAIIYTGSVVIPLNYTLSMQELMDDIAFSDAKAVIIGRIDEEVKSEILESIHIAGIFLEDMMIGVRKESLKNYSSVDSSLLACIIFTTGTTGRRKGVMLSQQNLMVGAVQAAAVTDVRQYRKTLATLPNYHILEISATYLSSMYSGTEVFLGKDAKYFAQNMRNEKPEIVQVVPLFLQMIEKKIKTTVKVTGKRKFDLAVKLCRGLRFLGIDLYRKVFRKVYVELDNDIKTFVVGGAFLSHETVDFFRGIGITILQGYGMTETVGAVSCNREYDVNSKSVGTAMPFTELRIKDGEIQVKGKNVMMGYYKEPELTGEAFDDEWLRTGDLGYIDEKGFLYLTGRKKNLIILSDGENVSPEIFEEKLQNRCEDMDEVLVFQKDGKIMANVYCEEKKQGKVKEAIDQFNTTIPYSQRIQNVYFRDEPLSRTRNGKLKR